MAQDPKYLVDILNANVDNGSLSDEEFRQFVRNTLPLYTKTEIRTRELEPGEEPLREYSYNNDFEVYQ